MYGKREVGRGDMIRVSGMAERTGRMLLEQLLDEGLLVANMPKGPGWHSRPLWPVVSGSVSGTGCEVNELLKDRQG
jgi:hypothetical protein